MPTNGVGKGWTYSAGTKPNTVTVFEREPGGVLYARAWDSTSKSFIRQSLKHRDRAKAKRWATEQAAKLQKGESELMEEKSTLAHVLAQYLAHRSPRKAESEQQGDKRRAEMWTRVLGGDTDPHRVTLHQWESFIDARTSGLIDPRGRTVSTLDRKRVRARTVEEDCLWLSGVFSWATKWRLQTGRYLMRENPCRGYEAPKELNPRRPVASHDRFEKVRSVSDRHTMEIRKDGRRIPVRSYLSELLDIVQGTGRRINAVCQLRFDDLRLARTRTAPHGAIRWRAESDKTKRETVVPISAGVRAALDRIVKERPALGAVPLFPMTSNPERPISRHMADAWLRKAETMAGLEGQEGSLWHAYRRKWATERKHLPLHDVAAAGGWTSTESLRVSYMHADELTMLEVVLGGGELREAR